MQRLSFSIGPRNDIILKNGNSPIFIRFYISGKNKRFKIPNVDFLLQNWDTKTNSLKKSELYYIQKNIIINNFKLKTQKIILKYTEENKPITFELFEKELYNDISKTQSFYDFAYDLIKKKYRNDNTIKDVKKHVNKIKEFKPNLAIQDIDYDFILSYKMHLKEIGNAPGTIAKAQSVLRMFINEARKRKINVDNPFDNIKIPTIKGKHLILTKEELAKLINYYNTQKELTFKKNETLRAFLFSCFTSLRYGDVKAIKYCNINNDEIIITEEKNNEDLGKKERRFPLSEFAKSLISKKHSSPKQDIFNLSSNQVVNRHLKEIARKININPELSFHYARRTFSTFIYNATGDMYLASDMTGHSNINTTINHYSSPLQEKRKQALTDLENYVFEKQ